MKSQDLLDQINAQINKCSGCRLCKVRIKAVPGEGPVGSLLAFVGEAPGANEDRSGTPFCGRAGDLLDRLLIMIGVKRSQIWVGNVLKCRPPENRGPMVDEVRACRTYLEKQLELIGPRLVIPLGKFATDHFIPEARISQVKGIPVRSGGFLIYPVYHPAAALRSSAVLAELEKGFKKIPAVLSADPHQFPIVGGSKISENQVSLF